jgi:hypothetical protein
MFSPSLLSMMWLVLASGNTSEYVMERSLDVADSLGDAYDRFLATGQMMPELPVIARSSNFQQLKYFDNWMRLVEAPGDRKYFAFGRIPVDRLVDYLARRHGVDSDEEFLDIGTPLTESHAAPAGSPGAECLRMMPLTRISPQVDLAVVERGVAAGAAGPQTFGGKLALSGASGLDLSDHCVAVLSVLLGRLEKRGILGDSALHCALVPDPKSSIGPSCFAHANSVELMSTLTDLHRALMPSSMPACINLSMGTHVGPHDGNSPLEDFVRSHFAKAPDRYMHVAAGNDGGRGIAAIRDVRGGVDEFLTLKMGPSGCSTVLVELWWDDALAILEIEVVLVPVAGKPVTVRPLKISSTSAAVAFGAPTAGSFSGITTQALFHGACHAQRSCIAFSLGASNPALLANMDVCITMRATGRALVNAWLVVCEDKRTGFAESGTFASIRVPACDPAVVSVAGATASGQPWVSSSRGPSAVYDPYMPFPSKAPYLAHLVELAGSDSCGTSFASPRACADTAEQLLSGHAAKDADQAARNIVGAHGATGGVGRWGSRTGYGIVT